MRDPIGKVVYLVVPFADKAEVKALGARWNPRTRHWFIWPDADLSKFDRWLPESEKTKQINRRSDEHLKGISHE